MVAIIKPDVSEFNRCRYVSSSSISNSGINENPAFNNGYASDRKYAAIDSITKPLDFINGNYYEYDSEQGGNFLGHGLIRIEISAGGHEEIYGNRPSSVLNHSEVVDLSRHLVENGGSSTWARILVYAYGSYTPEETVYATATTNTWGGLTTAYDGLSPLLDWRTPGSQSQDGDNWVEDVDYAIGTTTQPHQNGSRVNVKYLYNPITGETKNYTGYSTGLNYYTSNSFYFRKKNSQYPVTTLGRNSFSMFIKEVWEHGSRVIYDQADLSGVNANLYLYITGQNPCSVGTHWEEECQECICDIITDGTLAGIINSIVL